MYCMMPFIIINVIIIILSLSFVTLSKFNKVYVYPTTLSTEIYITVTHISI